MTPDQTETVATPQETTAREWVKILAKYREPNHGRSLFELMVTLVPFLAIWALAWWALSLSGWLAVALASVNAVFLVRLFAIQHDCGHSAFFRSRVAGDWLGRTLGVLTLTPYDVWRRVHSVHHSGAGNLDKRGMGDIHTLTIDEYRALSRFDRLMYRLYRNPIVLFGVGPIYLYILQNRLPFGLMKDGARYWISAIGTNVVLAVVLGVIVWFGGLQPLLLIFLPTSIVAGAIGIWLFYVQHQFEQTQWDNGEVWNVHDSALHGSSHYVLPQPLQWLTANIGVHHVHHLYARIPFYRLPEVLRDNSALNDAQRMTLRESLQTIKLILWDSQERRLVSYAQARATYGNL
jgi:omega-6 fatty acid desaturase (delta-12 desaturase)